MTDNFNTTETINTSGITDPADSYDPTDVDIHGKLVHLNAVDMSDLPINQRYVMIFLMGPWATDDFGRIMTPAGTHPRIPGLSERQVRHAIQGLIEKKLIRSWPHGGSTCWEMSGGYSFKKNRQGGLKERKYLAMQKRNEKGIRSFRRKEAHEGIPYASEDDGKGTTDEGRVNDFIRTKRGNHVPNSPLLWFRSNVPVPKRKSQFEMIKPQPESTQGCILRMWPSFNPAEGLSPLGTVLWFNLLMDADDYGRVRIDVDALYARLGKVITKRLTKAQIDEEIHAMHKSRHLALVPRPEGLFAYIRDSAQHKKNEKRYNRDIPRLYQDRYLTYDSEKYKCFFKACENHAASRAKVRAGQYCQNGDLNRVWEYVDIAADRFVDEYENLISGEPYCSMSPEEFCGISIESWRADLPDFRYRFWHAIQHDLPPAMVGAIYLEYQEELDSGDQHTIFTYLLGTTPAELVKQMKDAGRDGKATNTNREVPPVVPDDNDDIPPVVP